MVQQDMRNQATETKLYQHQDQRKEKNNEGAILLCILMYI